MGSHPPRLPSSSGSSSGPAFPLRLDFRNNLVDDCEGLVRRVESAGGAGAVQICVTQGDGPAPAPVEANRPLPYLWVFLPRLAEQRRAQREDHRREKGVRKEKEKESKEKKEGKAEGKRNKEKKHDKREAEKEREK